MLYTQASFRETRDIMHGETKALEDEFLSGSQCKFHPHQPTKIGLFLPAVLGPYPQPSALPVTDGTHTVYALHLKDEPVPNLRSAVNHQALLLPKGRKHLIMCFQLCQRKRALPSFDSVQVSEEFAVVCVGDGNVGGQL